MIYCIFLIALTAAFGSVVPIIQYLVQRSRTKSQVTKLLFHQSLLDFDMDNMRYELAYCKNDIFISRHALKDRGWVRGPNGTVLNDMDFESKKKCEYKIALP